MATYTAGIKVQVEGASQFKADLRNLTQKSKELESQMKAVATQANSEDAKMETLSAQIQNQKEIISKLNTNLDAQKSALKELQTQLSAAKTAYSQNEDKVNSLNAELEEEKEVLDKLGKELEEAKSEYGENSDEVKELTQRYTEQETKVSSLTSALDDATTEQAASQKEVTKLTTAVTNQETAISKTQTAINNATADLDEFGEESEDSAQQVGDSFADVATLIGASELKEVIKEIASAISECVSTAADFEAQMSTVEALSGATADELDELSAKAQELGSSTVYTATEAAEAMEYMALAGWSTEEVLEGVDAVLNLAAASAMDLGEASDIVTDYITAFGLSASDAEYFVDEMAYAMSNSNTTTEELGEAYKNCASTAASMGFSVEDVTATLMVMANAGVKGSEAGSGLSTIMTRLATNTKSCESAISDYTEELLGYEFSMYDANGEMRDMSDILEELGDLWPLLTDEQQANLAKTIAGTNQYSKFQTIMAGLTDTTEDGVSSFTAYAAALSECSGTAEDMAETQLDNLNGSITLLNSAVDGLKTTIGSQLSPVIQSIVDVGTNAISGINDFLAQYPNVTAALTGIAVGLSAVIAVLIVIATVSIPAVQTAIQNMFLVIESNPIGAIVTLIGAAVAAIATFAAVAISNSTSMQKEAKEEKKEVEELIDAYEELAEETEASHGTTDQLVEEIESLIDVEDKSAAQKVVLADLVDQLNEQVEGLNLTYDEETDSLNMTTDAVERYVSAVQEEDELSDIETSLNDLYAERTSLLAEIEQQQADCEEAYENYNEIVANADMTQANYNDRIYAASFACKELDDALATNQETLALLDEQIAELEGTYNEYSETVESTTEVTDDSIQTYVDSVISNLETLNTEYAEAYEAAYESLSGQFDLWDDLSDQTAMSTDEIWTALESQEAYWQEYSDNLADLNSRNIEGLDEFVASVADGTTDSASYIAGLADMTDTELERYLEEWQEMQETSISDSAEYVADMETSYSEMADDIINDLVQMMEDADLSEEAKEAAISTIEGYQEGVSGETSDTTTTVQTWAQKILSAARTALGIASPSTKFKTIGQQSIQGFINGVNGKSSSLTSSLKSIAQSALSSFKENITTSSMRSVGVNVIQGFINGVSSKASSLYQKMRSIASNALSTFMNKLGISSPSVEFASVGMYAMLGYIEGVESEEKSITDTMQEMAQVALDSFNTEYEAGFNTDALSMKAATSLVSDSTASRANSVTSNTNNTITLNVYGAEGQDTNSLAQIVMNKINQQIRRTGAVYG